MSRILLLNKPFNVMCQFTDTQDRSTLADFCSIKDVYAAGRLDYDSEGLLILTDDGWLQNLIAHPRYKLPKTYLVQVEGTITDEALARLKKGVELKDGLTKPADARSTSEPSWLWERTPPVRFRANIPTSWIFLTIREGRNRQVRRMTAAVGFPTLRLIRTSIGPWNIDSLQNGCWKDATPFQNQAEAERLFMQWSDSEKGNTVSKSNGSRKNRSPRGESRRFR